MLYTEAQKQEHIEEILTYLYEIALRDPRIPIVLPAKEFTEEAALAVRAYQQAYGLPVTGEIDDATWDSIVESYRARMDGSVPLTVFPPGNFRLQEGDAGDLVYLVQVLLRLIGNYYGNLDPPPLSGSYDADTAEAVRRLQEIAALPQTGALDRRTWDRIAALVNRLPLEL
ncbi:MAG: peptidoglycan-binding protein [Oscillospiraceae bacterium]|nr:peptidoglycan-binding protein [Oscillospiraceae bacterium]